MLHYVDGEKRYILAPHGLKVGDEVMSGAKADIRIGNALPLSNMPLGSVIHNVELKPGKGGQLVRSAGNMAQLMAREGKYAQIRLPSGEVRMVNVNCKATLGQVGNIENENITIGKQEEHGGRAEDLTFVVLLESSDHLMVVEKEDPIGMPSPVTPWGKPHWVIKQGRRKT